MAGYTKLFGEDLLRSSVWQAPLHVRIVWITMLALKDEKGIVSASVPGLAHAAGVTIEQCEDALGYFLGPDKYSRTKDQEGRRIAEVDGGWQMINHYKYRAKLDAAEQREKAAERMRKLRADRANAGEQPEQGRTDPNRGEQPERVTDVRDPDPDPVETLSLGSESPPSGLPDPGALVGADLGAPPPDEPPPGMALEMPRDWKPVPEPDLERQAADLGIDLASELRKLRDRGERQVDWQARWRTWLGHAIAFARKNRKPAQPSPDRTRDSARDAEHERADAERLAAAAAIMTDADDLATWKAKRAQADAERVARGARR